MSSIPDFIGIDTHYRLADGRWTRRHYLDSAASTLALRCARQVVDQLLPHYANTHSQAYFAARITNSAWDWAHQQVLHYLGAINSAEYCAIFAGSGSTSHLNRLARTLNAQRPHRDIVLVSAMEHHANDLPHRKHAGQVISVPLLGNAPALGAVDLSALECLLAQYSERVNYLAITAASNVTGIINPLATISALAHAYDVLVVVDASQAIAHMPLCLANCDALIFSGHKIYAPGAPGIMVIRRALLADAAPDELGGGIIDDVTISAYQITERLPEREEAGTPNITGAVQLGAALNILRNLGMTDIYLAEQQLLQRLLTGLNLMPQVQIYGDLNMERSPRLGVVAFNLAGIEHGLVAAILNDYHNVAVRNGCFCAHPYVAELLKPELWALDIDPDALHATAQIQAWRGMVRASLGLYSNTEDVDALLNGVRDVLENITYYREQYVMDASGNFQHRSFNPSANKLFNPEAIIEKQLLQCGSKSMPLFTN